MKPKLLAVVLPFLIAANAIAQTAKHLEDQIYMKDGGTAFTCDVSLPTKSNGIAILHMVSGGWASDHKNINPALAAAANARGFTLVQVVHGTQPKFKVPEILKQISRAVRFVRYNAKAYGINPNKIAITGGSSGGHLSLMTAAAGAEGIPNSTDPIDQTSAVINSVGVFFPPTDFMNFGKEGVFSFDNPLLKSAFGKAFIDDEKSAKREDMIKMGQTLSPINFITDKMPPTMLVHGDKDMLVPLQQSQIAIAKLESLKIKCKLEVVPGGGHGWANMIPQLNHLMDWFEETLKLSRKQLIPPPKNKRDP